MANYCSLPGCHYTKRWALRHNLPLRSMYKVKRPEFARKEEDREHRMIMTNFVLFHRGDDEKTRSMLHKESTGICDHHFSPNDIIMTRSKRRLRCGALPALFHPDRKPPLMTSTTPKEVIFKDFWRRLLCCIPGCNEEVFEEFKRTDVHQSNQFFLAKNPKFLGPNDDRREWYDKLMKLLLEYSSDLQKLFDYDQVMICQRHFADTDLIEIEVKNGNKRKQLRIGAMPAFCLPPKRQRTQLQRKKKKQRSIIATSKPSTVRLNTFANLVAAARRLLYCSKAWTVKLEKGCIICWKNGTTGYDQKEFLIKIMEDFRIGIVYLGWCLPEGHFATQYNLQVNTLSSFLAFLESLKPCDGVNIPTDPVIPNREDILKHQVVNARDPFDFQPSTTSLLAHRSRNCDVLLSELSYGSCKSCYPLNETVKKQTEELKKSANIPYTSAPKVLDTDSYECQRLKFSLKKKHIECKKLFARYHNLNATAKRKQAICESLLLKKKATINDLMEPVEKFARLNKVPAVFIIFWRFQLKTILRGSTSPLQNPNLHHPREILVLWSEIWDRCKRAYRRLRNMNVLFMPSPDTVNKFTEEYKKQKQQNMESIIEGVGVSDGSMPQPSSPEASQVPMQTPSLTLSPFSRNFKEFSACYSVGDFAPSTNTGTLSLCTEPAINATQPLPIKRIYPWTKSAQKKSGNTIRQTHSFVLAGITKSNTFWEAHQNEKVPALPGERVYPWSRWSRKNQTKNKYRSTVDEHRIKTKQTNEKSNKDLQKQPSPVDKSLNASHSPNEFEGPAAKKSKTFTVPIAETPTTVIIGEVVENLQKEPSSSSENIIVQVDLVDEIDENSISPLRAKEESSRLFDMPVSIRDLQWTTENVS